MAPVNRYFSDKLLNEFEEQLQCSSSLGELRSMMDDNLANLGFASYAYIRISVEPDGTWEIGGLTNYPSDWCKHYRDADYFTIDPTLWYCESEFRPVAWHELGKVHRHKGFCADVFEEARLFGLRNGITVPLHGGDGWLSAMNVVTDLARREAARLVTAHMEIVQIMSILFHGIAEERVRTSELQFPTSAQTDKPIFGYRVPGVTRRMQ
jgi:Autoinducer binding domain